MRPIYDWTVRRGYTFGVPTFYNSFHVGLDLIVPQGTIIVAPTSGIAVPSFGPQGGNTITLGDIRFMHLSKFRKTGVVKKGDILGESGDTGLSTAPHLHVDVRVDGSFANPETYFMPEPIPVVIVGHPIVGLKEQVEYWSKGFFTTEETFIPMDLAYDPARDYTNLLRGRFCIVSCNPAPQIYKTSISDDLKTAYAIAGSDALTASYEVSHMLHKYYLAHRGSNPYIEIDDTVGGVTNEQRYHKFDVMKPYTGIILGSDIDYSMTKEEVIQQYVLSFYREPDAGELAFWTGKSLKEFLSTAIKDRSAFLAAHQ